MEIGKLIDTKLNLVNWYYQPSKSTVDFGLKFVCKFEEMLLASMLQCIRFLSKTY